MKLSSLRLALLTALLAIVFSATGRPDDGGAITSPRQGPQAKLEYCKTCHGLSGQGYYGYFPIPGLAGQQPKYLENQLRAFIERRRTNPVMFNVAHSLSPSMVATLAAHFRNLDRDQSAVVRGITWRREERSTRRDYPNPTCRRAPHGAEAKGQDEIPRLAGQLFPHTMKELTNWSKERGQGGTKDDTSAIMAPTAHNLT